MHMHVYLGFGAPVMSDLTLVSYDLCPYVQRAAIALAEKGVPFRRVDVDLADKPSWFRAISPLGKVPLLRVGDDVLFESAAIVEYLEETNAHPLHPAAPLERAKHRAWMEFGSSVLADIWVIETTPDRAAFVAKRDVLKDKFKRIEGTLTRGPHFAGARFSLVDVVFAPVFRYFETFERFVDLGLFEAVPKVSTWRAALAKRPSVIGAVLPDYSARLEAFLRRKNGWIAGLMARAA
jgi:glutathione S-transferase